MRMSGSKEDGQATTLVCRLGDPSTLFVRVELVSDM